jgi:hypothetical protein
MKPSDIVNLTEAYQTKIVPIVKSSETIVPVKPVQHTIMQDEEQPQEQYDNNESDACEMAKSDLRAIISDATKILNILNTNVKMEPWVASKITLASDYLNSSEKWLSHEGEKASNAPM